jgi:ATP-binding cassette subfamily C (CFTR/MRP) protein 1
MFSVHLLTIKGVWLKWWSDANTRDPNQKIFLYLGVYGLLQVLGLASLSLVAWHALRTMVSRSGARLHLRILDTAMAASMAFFSTTDIGVTTNR